MKITKAYLDGAEYSLVDSSVVNHSNIVTVLIGKNGTGKSRMLANIVELFKISQEYNQNHPKLKSNRVSRLEFENDGEAAHAEKDELAKEIQASQASYLEQVRSWTDISHRAYLNSQAK